MSDVVKIIHKPVTKKAIRWKGALTPEIQAFVARYKLDGDKLIIPTLEGDMIANKGDWIVKGVKDECYPVKPDVFEKTYDIISNGDGKKILFLDIDGVLNSIRSFYDESKKEKKRHITM